MLTVFVKFNQLIKQTDSKLQALSVPHVLFSIVNEEWTPDHGDADDEDDEPSHSLTHKKAKKDYC